MENNVERREPIEIDETLDETSIKNMIMNKAY